MCRAAGERLGFRDAGRAVFRTAAGMIGLWEGLDLPAHLAPYALREARLGYLKGYKARLLAGDLPATDRGESPSLERAARARWGESWRVRLEQSRSRRG